LIKIKLLVVCTSFYPRLASGSIRTTKLVKYLVQNGFDITVISPPTNPVEKTDETLGANELSQIRRIIIPHSKYFSKTLLGLRNKVVEEKIGNNISATRTGMLKKRLQSVVTRYFQEIYAILRNLDWFFQVKRYLHNHETVCGFDCVLTSHPNWSVHLIGESIKKKRIAEKWVADFRDYVAYEAMNTKYFYRVYKKLEKKFCERADVITCVSKGMMTKLTEGFEDKSKFNYLPNGFDFDDLKYIRDVQFNDLQNYRDIFKITYAGRLHKEIRDVSVVFKLIKRLIDEKKVQKEKIKFVYVGKDFANLFEQAKKFCLQDILVNIGYVRREISLQIQSLSGLIVISTWNSDHDQGVVTGKVYESFLLRKPTLAIINGTQPNSELGKMVTKSGLGFAYDTMINDPIYEDKLSQFIKSCYDSIIKGSEIQLDINEPYIDFFNYKQITKRLVDILS
jgi:hypothetical protein